MPAIKQSYIILIYKYIENDNNLLCSQLLKNFQWVECVLPHLISVATNKVL